MPTYEIQGADGEIYEVDAPDENAAILAQQEMSQPEWSGSIIPWSIYPDGRSEFDSDAGLLGPIKRAFQLPSKVMSGDVQVMDPYTGHVSDDVISQSTEFGLMFGGANPMVRSGDKAIPGIGKNTRRIKPAKPTANELKSAGKAGYDAMRATGAEYSADDVARMARETIIKMNEEGFNEVTSPSTFKTLNQLANPPAGSTANINGMHSARKVFGKLGQKFNDPADQAAAGIAKRRIDEFIGGGFSGPNSAIPANSKQKVAAALLKESNANFSAGKRSDLIGGIDKFSGLRADAANSGQNLGNAIRSRVASALEKPKKISGFNQGEVAELEGLVHGSKGANFTRDMANRLGGGGGIGSAIVSGGGAAAGGMVGGPVGAVVGATAGPVAGGILKSTSNNMTKKALSAVDDTIRARSPLYEEMKRQAPKVVNGPTKKQAVLRALAASKLDGKKEQQERFKEALRRGNGA